MNPQAPAPEPAPAPFNPNAAQTKQHKLIRLIIILAAVGVLVLILVSVLSGPPKNSEVSAVLANQQEMLRIIDARREDLTSTETANFISIARPVLLTNSRELANAGVSVTAPINGASIDAQLDEAVRSSRLDQQLQQLLLATMEKDLIILKQTEAATEDGAKLKAVLKSIIEDYSVLVAAEE